MSSALKGSPQLKARLKAIATNTFKPAGRDWADEAVRLGKSRVGSYHMPYSKNVLVPSIRRKSATAKRAVVNASFHAYFIDAGTQGAGRQSRARRAAAQRQRTVFSRKARKPHKGGGYRARPFRDWMAAEALRRKPMSEALIKAWNEAG